MSEKELNFETAMEQLEQIVTQLESGDVPLEKAIDLFQEGMKLSQLCGQKLEHVEKKIEMLIEKDNTLEKEDFLPIEDDKGD